MSRLPAPARLFLAVLPERWRSESAGDLHVVHRRRRQRLGRSAAWVVTSLDALWVCLCLISARRSAWAFLRDDLRSARRSLTRSPAVALTSVLVAGLGIGTVTAFFSVANSILLAPLPYASPESLVALDEVRGREGAYRSSVSAAAMELLRSRSRTLDAVEGWDGRTLALAGARGAESVAAAFVTPGLFSSLGGPARIGRGLLPHDLGAQVVVLSHRAWTSRFGADPEVIGRVLRIEDMTYEVVGVMPRRFGLGQGQELYLPLDANAAADRTDRSFQVLARRVPGATEEAVAEELAALSGALAAAVGEPSRLHVLPPLEERQQFFGPFIWIFLAAAMLLLVVTCSNVAGLLLARGARRRSQVAVRAALGGTGQRIFLQQMMETLLMAGAAGLLGIALAHWGARLFWVSLPIPALPWFIEPGRIDWRVLSIAALCTLTTVLVVGIAPALAAARTNVLSILKGAGVGATGSRERHRLRRGVVVVQLALTFLFMVTASFAWLSNRRSEDIDLGWDVGVVLQGLVRPEPSRYPDAPSRLRFRELLAQRLAGQSGLQGVAWSGSVRTVRHADGWNEVSVGDTLRGTDGAVPPRDWELRAVDPSYFRVRGMELVQGEGLEASASFTPAVISRSLAEDLWGAKPAPGRTVDLEAFPGRVRITGVASDTRVLRGGRRGLELHTERVLYVPAGRVDLGNPRLLVRVAGAGFMAARTGAQSAAAQVRAAGRAVDPFQPVEVAPAGANEAALVGGVLGSLSAAFGAVALLLSVLGLYALISQSLALRTRELGIRTALGASPRQIVRDVMNDGLRLTLLGLLVGAALTAGAYFMLRLFLFSVSPLEPGAYLVGGVVLALVMLAASLKPIRRALAIHPVEALRAE